MGLFNNHPCIIYIWSVGLHYGTYDDLQSLKYKRVLRSHKGTFISV